LFDFTITQTNPNLP